MSRIRGTRGVLLITAGLIGSLLYVNSASGVARFGDVEPMRFYTPAVQWMVDEEITEGTSEFCFSPYRFVTRGEAAAFMWRMMGFPVPLGDHPFDDVFKAWQQDPISWMFWLGITQGTSATEYSPERFLTRAELAALLFRLEGSPGGSPLHPFIDVFKAWQQDPISWMFFLAITTGTSPSEFSPDEFVTRGQLAAFFYRYFGSPEVQVVSSSPDCPDSDPTNPGDVKNCGDFDDRGAAQRYYDYYYPFYGDVAGLDGDGNMMVCEALSTTSTTSTTSTSSTSSTSTSSTSSTSTTTTMGGGSTTTTTTMPPDGMALYNNTPGNGFDCAQCHGANGQGVGGANPGGPDINPLPGNINSVGDVLNQINNGGNGMPTNFSMRMTLAQRQAVAQWVWDTFQ